MTDHKPTSILLLGSTLSLAEALDAWLHAHFAEPLAIASVHEISDALAYLRSHHVDLVLVDEAAAQNDLRTIHHDSPATAVIALVMGKEESLLLRLLRQGAHEVLCLLPSADADHVGIIERALARANGRSGIVRESGTRSFENPSSARLIHDLNNFLTSINGFADLLLNQLPPDHPARMGAEQIRLAGKRATTLLKAHSPTTPVSPSSSAPATQPVTVRAA